MGTKVYELKKEPAVDFSTWTGCQRVTGYTYICFLTLFCGSYETEQEQNGNDIIAQAFNTLSPLGASVLHLIAYHAPESLGEYLDYVREANDGAEIIAGAAALICKNGYMGLHAVILYAPDYFPALLLYMKETSRGNEIIKLALEMKVEVETRVNNSPFQKEEMTGYELIECRTPQHIHLVQEFIECDSLAAAPQLRIR